MRKVSRKKYVSVNKIKKENILVWIKVDHKRQNLLIVIFSELG